MKKQMLTALLTLGLVTPAAQLAHADHLRTPVNETLDIVSWWGFGISVGETVSRKLDREVYVENLIISAEGSSSREAMFDVMVNGKTKGTIHVPGRDPSYVVTVAEVVNSVEFRHLSGGTVKINDIKVNVNNRKSQFTAHARHTLSMPARNEAMLLARETIMIIDQLQPSLSGTAFDTYLLPIKIAAASVYAKANAQGDLSYDVLNALTKLNYQIGLQKQYVESALAVGSTFEMGVALLSVFERINEVSK